MSVKHMVEALLDRLRHQCHIAMPPLRSCPARAKYDIKMKIEKLRAVHFRRA